MPDPTSHTNVIAPLIGGLISSVVSGLFDIEPNLVLVAFIGAWSAVALREPIPTFASKFAAFSHFMKITVIVVIGTIIAAWCIPEILKAVPSATQKTVSGLTGFVLVFFYSQIIDFVKFLFEQGKVFVTRLLSLKFGKGDSQ